MRLTRRLTWRRLLCLGLSLCALSVGCATRGAEKRFCPRPTNAEVDSYEALVASGQYAAHVAWVGRVVPYCWPRVSALERGTDE